MRKRRSWTALVSPAARAASMSSRFAVRIYGSCSRRSRAIASRAWFFTSVEKRASARAASRAAMPFAPTSLTSVVIVVWLRFAAVVIVAGGYLWRRCQRVFFSILRCLCLLIFFLRFLTTEPMKPPDTEWNKATALFPAPNRRCLYWLELEQRCFGRNAIVSRRHRHVYPYVVWSAVPDVRRDAWAFRQLDDREHVRNVVRERWVHCAPHDCEGVHFPPAAGCRPLEALRKAVRADAPGVEHVALALGAALQSQLSRFQPIPERRRDRRGGGQRLLVLDVCFAHCTAKTRDTCSLMIPLLPLTYAISQSLT